MPGILVLALIIIGILYLVGFSAWTAILICLLFFGIIFSIAALVESDLLRRWHVIVFLVVCFLGNRGCSYVVSERQLHQPLSVVTNTQIKAILSPQNFPSIPGLDESQFDVASDGSLLFRNNDQLIACTPSDSEPALAVLAESPGLSSFILDSGGTLLTMNRGVLGQFNPTQPQTPGTTWQDGNAQIDLAQMIPTVPRSQPVPVGPVGGPYYTGSGGGSSGPASPRITISDAFRWFFLPSDDQVSETFGSPPPPLSDGAHNYVVAINIPPQVPKYPQPLQLLPDPEMHIARGGDAGQVLVFGGQNQTMARELHRIYADGSAQWVVDAAQPIRFAAESHGQLYIVTCETFEGDSDSARRWTIIHLPLGTKEINRPELVFKSNQLQGDTRIQSLALSESGETLFFSVPNRVYAIHGPLVVKLLDGISGILRTHGETLYLFNARRKALLAITGF